MKKVLLAIAIITPWIAIVVLTTILITGNLSINVAPEPSQGTESQITTAEPTTEPTTTPSPTESAQNPPENPSEVPTTATEPTASVEQTTATVPTEPVTEPTNASSEPISEPTANVEPTTATEMQEPTVEPTSATVEPTTEPTAVPTIEPTTEPTTEPTAAPTTEPTAVPTIEPTTKPTTEPTQEPTTAATEPTTEPTQEPHIHTWDDGVVTKEATYTEGGEIKYTCIICGEIMVEKTDPKEIVPGYVEVRRELNEWGYTLIYYEVTLSSGETKSLVIRLPKGDFTNNETPVVQYSISKGACSLDFSIIIGVSDFMPAYPKFFMEDTLVAEYINANFMGTFAFGDNVEFKGQPQIGSRHTITFEAELVEKPNGLGTTFSSDDFKDAVKTGIIFTYPKVIIDVVE